MSDVNEVVSTLRATLLSCKGALTINQCNRDYRELSGENIPYKKLGYRTLEDLFRDVPGFRVTSTPQGEFQVDAIASQETRGIADMVSRQKNNKPSKKFYQQPPRRYPMNYSNKFNNNNWRNNAPYQNGFKWNLKKKNSYDEPPSAMPAPKPVAKKPHAKEEPAPVRKVSAPSRGPAGPVEPSAPREEPLPPAPGSKLSGLRPGDILAKAQIPLTVKFQNDSNKQQTRTVSVKSTAPAPKSANARLNALQSKLHNETEHKEPVRSAEPRITLPPLVLSMPEPVAPKINYSARLEEKMKEISSNPSIKDKTRQKLIAACSIMDLPEPIFKTQQSNCKGPTTFDCAVKIPNNFSFTTYPDSLPTREKAEEVAGLAALAHVVKLCEARGALPSPGVKELPISQPSNALSRVAAILARHPSGLWADNLPQLYITEFQENLPSNWLELLKMCRSVAVEEVGSGRCPILLPQDPSKAPLPSPSPSPSPTHTPLPNNNLISTSTAPTLSLDSLSLESLPNDWPPPLQYPDQETWNVYVMQANSPVDIWLRIIGEEYSDKYDMMSQQLDTEMPLNGVSARGSVCEGGCYALHTPEGWLRVSVGQLLPQEGRASCFCLDTGEEQAHPLSSLYELPKHYLNLPPQAILCRLSGLEYFTAISGENSPLLTLLVNKVLVAEVLETPEDGSDDLCITVVLYDTSTDVDINLNKELLCRMSQAVQPPRLMPGVTEVHVCEVNAGGQICVQVHNESWQLLQQMLKQVVAGPFPKEALNASFTMSSPTPTTYYLVKSSTGEWMRAQFRGVADSSDGLGKVSVRLIDCGRTETVPVEEVLILHRLSEALNCIPPQVLYLRLHGVPALSPPQLQQLRNMLPPDQPALCKPTSPDSDTVELFVRTEPHRVLCSVNNAINLELSIGQFKDGNDAKEQQAAVQKKKHRVYSRGNSVLSNGPEPVDRLTGPETVPLFPIPSKGTEMEVKVLLAANPWNFIVQPLMQESALRLLMEELQKACHALPAQPPDPPIMGTVYAAYHAPGKTWYRAVTQGILSKTEASVYLVDFGNLCMVEVSTLRVLPPAFRNLPKQAIKAKLSGISPINQDWSVDDCLRFQQLTVNQKFVSVVDDIQEDPIHRGEVLLSLNLIDRTTSRDLFLHQLLAKEGRAILT